MVFPVLFTINGPYGTQLHVRRIDDWAKGTISGVLETGPTNQHGLLPGALYPARMYNFGKPESSRGILIGKGAEVFVEDLAAFISTIVQRVREATRDDEHTLPEFLRKAGDELLWMKTKKH